MGEFDPVKQQVVDSAQFLTGKGFLIATGGNISIRIPAKNAFAVTPSDYDYMKMVPEDICVLDLSLQMLEGFRKPSVESALHCAVYQTRPDVNVIVHTHQVYASTLGLIDAPIPALYDEQVRFLGRSVEIIPYAPSGTSMLKNTIAKHVRDHNNAYIMRDHGVLCFGSDVDRALDNVQLLEKCALTYLLALCTEKKVSKIPLAVREIAFSKLRKDQEKMERGEYNPLGS